MIFRKKVLVFIFLLLWSHSAGAADIYLKNGDKISGAIAGDNGTALLVQTQEAGEIKIDKSFIDMAKTYPKKSVPVKVLSPQKVVVVVPVVPPVIWKKDLAVGYTQQGGNTKSQLAQISADVDRKTITNETSFKYDSNYSSSNGVMNGRKFFGELRYAYSFGQDLKWYNFYSLDGEQDYFADIYYRLNPTTGVGYWFSNTPDFKLKSELGIGYQYTRYRVESTPDGDGAVLVPRIFIDKRLFANIHLTEDISYYPSLGDFNDYHWRSETDLVNQITQEWDFKISYVNNFNNNPPLGFKKDDYTWITSLEYHF